VLDKAIMHDESSEAAVNPLVTAIISVHNEENHLAECLQSLKAQTYAPLEILVVDDGSTDRSRDVARRQGVRVVELPHRGKATAVNHGARVSLGEILLFLDGDMVFEPRYVQRLVAPILAGEALGTAHSEELVANPENRWARCLQAVSRLPLDRRFDYSERDLLEGSVVYRALRKSDFLAVGGFDDRGYVDDQTLYPKLGKRATFVTETSARHYNPETLREVWALGRWSGKSLAFQYGPRAVAAYALLPLTLARGLRYAVRERNPWLVPYCIVRDSGAFLSLLLRSIGVERHYGS
jgi:glycosyltransferase involved in cell wall biosynthesis